MSFIARSRNERDAAGVDSLRRIFEPDCIAFIGASESVDKIGGRRWKSLVEGGFKGRLFPVNNRSSRVLGHKAYASVLDVPETPDLAVVSVPVEYTPGVVDECIRRGVGNVMIITGGFGEVDEAGKEAERRIASALNGKASRLVGPNCAALYSGPAHVDIGGWPMKPGSIGVISQSGNVAIDLASHAQQRGGGFSRSITIGNAADIGTADILSYYLADPHTSAVLCYVEGLRIGEGRRLLDIMRASPVFKPAIFIKPGQSEAGRRAVSSHTGALAGEDAVFDAVMRQAGILRASSIEQGWSIAAAFARYPVDALSRVAVLTDGGGHATLASDALGAAGLEMANLSPASDAALAKLLPPRCPRSNPIDFAGEAESNPGIIPEALAIALADPSVDAAVLVGHFGGYHLIGGEALLPQENAAARKMVQVCAHSAKPVLFHSVHAERPLEPIEILSETGVAAFRSPAGPAEVLGGIASLARLRAQAESAPANSASPTAQGISETHLPEAGGGASSWLLEPQARQLLQAEGLDLPPSRVVASATECAEAVAELADLCALKVVSAQALHKSEVKGVVLNVAAAQAHSAFTDLSARMTALGIDHKILVTPMLKGEAECFVGAFVDPHFGPVVALGMGGTLVELLDDVAFKAAPVSRAEAWEMIGKTRLAKLFQGYRGGPLLDGEAFVDVVCKVGDIMSRRGDIAEIDLNPVFVGQAGALVADVRVGVAGEASAGLPAGRIVDAAGADI
ncbi:acetate--CoA ligase family protein [Mesorhizobium sp. A623]